MTKHQPYSSAEPAEIFCQRADGSYYAEIQAQRLHEAPEQVIDELIGLAIDTLDAHHFDLRITEGR